MLKKRGKPTLQSFLLPVTALFVAFPIGAAATDASFFSKQVYPVLQKANCRGCHVENGIASATRLHFPEPSASMAEIEAFGRSLAPLVDKDHVEQSLLLNKPTGRIQHTGGKLILPGSTQEALLREWASRVSRLASAETSLQTAASRNAAPVLMRRLTHSQYNHTVRDLLGDQTNPANQFPQEDFVNGFKNQLEAQGIPPLPAEAYSAAAERLARNAFRVAGKNPLLPCAPRSPVDSVCRDKFLRGFGLKALRRPLLDDEFERYSLLFTQEARRTGKFNSG